MATRYYKQASRALTPAYSQTSKAIKAQLPAIKQLYLSLNQGLAAQQAAGNQTILENAGGSNLLHSTIPVDNQMLLGQQIIGQRGQYASDEAKQVAGVNQDLGELRISKNSAIHALANSLRQGALDAKRLKLEKQRLSLERKRFAEDVRQYGLTYALEQQSLAEQQRRTNAQYGGGGNVNFSGNVKSYAPLAKKYFGKEWKKALWVIQHESGGNPTILGDGGHSYGLFQNQHIGRGAGIEEQFRAARRLFDNDRRNGGTGWGDWGEGRLYNGAPFGSLGNHPYPG